MLDDQAMADQWIIRVQDKEYGPAQLETLREWKAEGRVLPANPARRADDDDLWGTAAEIPGLFEAETTVSVPGRPPPPPRSFRQILGETVRVYRAGFFQFLILTLMVNLPFISAQLSASAVDTSAATPDSATALAGLFVFSMALLGLAMWPVYIAGIQLLAAEFAAGRKARVLDLFGQILGFWPRVAILCLFVYGVFTLLTLFALFIGAMMVAGASSLLVILLALGLLALQVWMFGRFFINVLFWQQFAVLGDCDVSTALRESKQLARSGHNLAWHQRPMWRGALIVSLWTAFVIAIFIGPEWGLIRQYWNFLPQLSNAADPQALLHSMRDSAQAQRGFEPVTFFLSLLQTVLRPLLGICFVLLYLDNRKDSTFPPKEVSS